jgi:biopolymer transport protein ExbD
MAVSSGFSSDDDGALSDINVTPLVDVVLVLLIVFMITVPAIVGSAPVKLELPVTGSVATTSEVLPLAFSLKRAESGELELYLNERKTSAEELRGMFKDMGASAQERHVSLAADKGIAYGDVIRFVDLLQSLGLKKLSLETRHVEKL